MITAKILFYIFASLSVLSAIFVVLGKNPIRGALALVLTFVSCASIWMLLHAEFLGLILVLVYVGAVMTLFLFVIMMLNVNVAHLRGNLVSYLPIAMIVVGFTFVVMLYVVGPHHFGLAQFPAPQNVPESNLTRLGLSLYTHFVLPFELAGGILLVAIISAIALTHRMRTNIKHQDINKQVHVKAKDRVEVIKMDAEKNQWSPSKMSDDGEKA